MILSQTYKFWAEFYFYIGEDKNIFTPCLKFWLRPRLLGEREFVNVVWIFEKAPYQKAFPVAIKWGDNQKMFAQSLFETADIVGETRKQFVN